MNAAAQRRLACPGRPRRRATARRATPSTARCRCCCRRARCVRSLGGLAGTFIEGNYALVVSARRGTRRTCSPAEFPASAVSSDSLTASMKPRNTRWCPLVRVRFSRANRGDNGGSCERTRPLFDKPSKAAVGKGPRELQPCPPRRCGARCADATVPKFRERPRSPNFELGFLGSKIILSTQESKMVLFNQFATAGFFLVGWKAFLTR